MTKTYGIVAYNEMKNEIVVAFRGSIGGPFDKNWKTNYQILTKSHPFFPNSNVHSGFYNAYAGV